MDEVRRLAQAGGGHARPLDQGVGDCQTAARAAVAVELEDGPTGRAGATDIAFAQRVRAAVANRLHQLANVQLIQARFEVVDDVGVIAVTPHHDVPARAEGHGLPTRAGIHHVVAGSCANAGVFRLRRDDVRVGGPVQHGRGRHRHRMKLHRADFNRAVLDARLVGKVGGHTVDELVESGIECRGGVGRKPDIAARRVEQLRIGIQIAATVGAKAGVPTRAATGALQDAFVREG